jgi:hypothetical protein
MAIFLQFAAAAVAGSLPLILSIDDEEFTPGPELDPAVLNLREVQLSAEFLTEFAQHKIAHLAAYPLNDIPGDWLQLSYVRGHAGIRGAAHHSRSTPYLDSAPPFFARWCITRW